MIFSICYMQKRLIAYGLIFIFTMSFISSNIPINDVGVNYNLGFLDFLLKNKEKIKVSSSITNIPNSNVKAISFVKQQGNVFQSTFTHSFSAFFKKGFNMVVLKASSKSVAGNVETLRKKIGVECLQDSQCKKREKCVNNYCINENQIDLCQRISLDTPTRKLKEGDSINSIKETIGRAQLPYLLSRGKLVTIEDKKINPISYIQLLIVGDNKLKKQNGEYVIAQDKAFYNYKLVFSKPVNFSRKDIQIQSLKILGKEYFIGEESSNEKIYLSYGEKIIELISGDNTEISRDSEGNVLVIEIELGESRKTSVFKTSSCEDNIFDSTVLLFDNIVNDAVEISIGGKC